MLYPLVKILITSVLIVGISELSKRSNLAGALLASIPLVSVLAMIWLYIDTRDPARISALATSIFWLVLPSLVLFLALPALLRAGMGFYAALAVSIGLTMLAYFAMIQGLRVAGIEI